MKVRMFLMKVVDLISQTVANVIVAISEAQDKRAIFFDMTEVCSL